MNFKEDLWFILLAFIFVTVVFFFFPPHVRAQTSNWENSPNNWNNNATNFNNSPNNWNNNPTNWNNSPNNWNPPNAIYDNQGYQSGYQTQAPSGVTNYFDNSGNRVGYGR